MRDLIATCVSHPKYYNEAMYILQVLMYFQVFKHNSVIVTKNCVVAGKKSPKWSACNNKYPQQD